MSLPSLPQKDNYRREVRTEWGGINLNENAGDGELIEAMNMSSREYPLLATEKMCRKNVLGYHLYAPFYYNGEGGVVAVTENNVTTYKIYEQGQVRNAAVNITENKLLQIRTAIMQDKLWIFPSKQVYDFSTHTISSMESSFSSGNSTVYFKDGTLFGVPADANTIYCSGANWANYFSVGDAVSISGSGLPENNKTPVIREIEGDELRFSENCFTVADDWHLYLYEPMLAGTYYFYLDGDEWRGFILDYAIPAGVMLHLVGNSIKYQVPGQMPVSLTTFTGGTPSGTEVTFLPPADADHITLSRTVPDLDFVCVNENRMWGCKGDTIYASKLGDPLNWNVFDGLSTDSWTVETGVPGSFTGCCSFQGYPTFFKEGSVFKVLGDEASNFALRKINVVGVAPYSDMSITEIRGRLYYVSIQGVMEWNGGDYPSIVSLPLGYDPSVISEYTSGSDGNYGASGGTDGNRYYLHCMYWKETNDSRPWRLLIFDPRFGTWHEQEQMNWPIWFVGDGANWFMLKQYFDAVSRDRKTDVFEISAPWQAYSNIPEWVPDWRVTFADSTRAYKTALTGSESKKGVLRLLIRCKLAGSMKVWIAYDGGEFEQAAEFGGDDGLPKTSRVVPLILRRCDFWQLRLTGTGDAVIYSIAVEKYGGEWQQA